ncbi:L-serine ammonia-lyase, iron-sulfur-dependent subunit beta [Jeotgalicoccus meleagridis]|uniref:L-serine deaminase n=1 Tax=Jeotgalicoccus meleagridis TaxID=2759181 RepID=A0A6V7RNQ4_9STAP|nr:L-serine ammonia-lyase, iron-sulfur-dependent subunit beta [Jeotgalicoccus meleagridis]CAD2079201.1 L-serine dehydratase, beta chain [Jeotgalicoccus meleagridis]HIW39229.1 L-serine ammonia-lyase, iron-sulfur-dependent subunit beta [Candidatus Jeotgalicoccus stercoravium]
MKFKSVFDIIGPVMVGPSSSHTAGAARIGLLARNLFGGQAEKVDIYLYGSFRDTYQGHATDVALLGGLLGYDTDDDRIIRAKEEAKLNNMEYSIIEMNEERSHPNTAVLHLFKGEEELVIEGVSIGGGKIELVSINGYNINLSGNYHALLVFHKDEFGTIARVTTKLGDEELNISQMSVSRKEKGQVALMTVELDDTISKEALEEIRAVKGVDRVIEMTGG